MMGFSGGLGKPGEWLRTNKKIVQHAAIGEVPGTIGANEHVEAGGDDVSQYLYRAECN